MLLLGTKIYAQQTVDSLVTKSNEFADRLNSIDSLKRIPHKKAFDSTHQALQLNLQKRSHELNKFRTDANKFRLDSLKYKVEDVLGDTVRKRMPERKQLKNKLKTGLDSLNTTGYTIDEVKALRQIDSATLKQKITSEAESKVAEKAGSKNLEEFNQLKTYKQQLDTGNTELIEQQAEQLISRHAADGKALEEAKMPTLMSTDFPFQKAEDFKWDKGKIASAAKLKDVLSEQSSKITEATDKVNKLKKKYSQYSYGGTSEELVKRNVPAKRWQFNLNLETALRPHFAIKAAPGLSFNTTKKHNVGLATSFDYQYHYGDSSYHQFNRQLSVRLFSQYKFYKQLFVQAEYEQPYSNAPLLNEKRGLHLSRQPARVWLGGGIEYKLYKKLRAQTQILYNIVAPKTLAEVQDRWAIRINLVY